MPNRECAGRPMSNNPKTNKVSMRLTDEEFTRFEAYAKEHNVAKADVLRKAVDLLFKADESKVESAVS